MRDLKQYAIRNIDGRLIETVKTREEARVRVRATAASFAEIADPPLDKITVELVGKPSVAALEFLLSLDPATCEREFLAELYQKLDERYPGETV